jgi:regulation of enolase protein 1 (concanavalin A-like superfamily)
MLMDALRQFEWIKEPFEISLDTGLKIVSSSKTDFWQSYREDSHKDNGHLFFSYQEVDFELIIKWRFLSLSDFSQCGLMVRIDEFNWFKMSIMSEDGDAYFIGSSVTNFGTSDFARHALVNKCENIWYRLKFKNGGFTAEYSTNGGLFYEIRVFDLLKDTKNYMAGAYICCPSEKRFSALLEHIEVIKPKANFV